MALPANGYIPERDDPYRRGTPAYYARLRAMLDAPIQGIAPGTGSFSTVGEPARPMAAKRRPFSLLADEDDAELGAAPVRPRRFSRLADQDDAELGAAQGRVSQPVTPSQPVDDAYRRGTPAYYARLQAMLDAPIQGIAPGYGSFSTVGEPAGPTTPKRRPFSLLADQDDAELGAAREPEPRRRLFDLLANQDDAELGAAQGWVSQPVTPSQPVDDAYRRGTPAYYARLQAMLDAPIQGIAPGYGSFSTVGEPARRTEPERRPFSLLADQDDAELGAAREPAPAPTQEPREPEPRRPRQFSPQADQDDAELGAARLRRRRQPFSLLADQDDAEFGAARVRPRSFSPLADQDDAELGAARLRRRHQPFSLLADGDDAEFGAAPVRPRQFSPIADQDDAELGAVRVSREDVDGIDPFKLAWGLARGGARLGLEGAKAGVDLGVDAGEFAFGLQQDAIELGLDVSDAVVDFGLDRAGDVIELAKPLDTGIVNPTLGAAIAAMTDCQDTRVLPPIRPGGQPVVFHENCGDALVFRATGGRPFTVGPHVFVRGTLNPGGLTERHEQGHAADEEEVGDLFFPLYFLELLAKGYYENAFEVEARNFARGQDTTAE